ncbi:MAG: UvrD-helicase domain-containing protein [Clostridia bacterium]|nr:UvrD-helicase domain-containing protein [Clostridia bacterium]
MANKWTEDQESAIYAKWRDKEKTKSSNILVNAAAGSGKTAVLVERIIQKLCCGEDSPDHCNADELLVVTFTNAAAKEMQQRISDALTKKYAQALDENNMETVHRLKKQLTLIYNADITTIDAFCLKTVKSYFHLLDTDPDFSIADSAECAMMKDEAIEELFEEYYDNEEFIKLLSLYADSRDDSNLSDIILKIYNFTRSLTDPDKWLEEQKNKFLSCSEQTDIVCIIMEKVKGEISFAKRLMIEGLSEMIGYISGRYEILTCEEIEGWLEKNPLFDENDLYLTFGTYYEVFYSEYYLYRSMELMSWDEILQCIIEHKFTRIDKKASPKNNDIYIKDKDFLSELKAKRDSAKDCFAEIGKYICVPMEDNIKELREKIYPQAELLVKFVKLFGEKYEAKKDEKNAKEFNDIEHLTLKLFRNNPDVCEEMKERYKEILMDEYQDSNELQEEIFKSISRGDNTFMVGDIKQSIYRFRSSEPDLFKTKCDTFEKKADTLNRKIVLSMNFRSRKEVLDSVNSVFESIMNDEVGGIVYDEDQKLYYGDTSYEDKNGENCGGYKSECYVIKSDVSEDEVKCEELCKEALEARFTAKKIKELKDNKFLVRDKRKIRTINEKNEPVEKEETFYRPLMNKDIVILMSTPKRYVKYFQKELSDLGIECFAYSGGYFDRNEIRLATALLKTIDNPYNDIALISVMRSIIGGFNDDELCVIRMYSDKTFYDALKNCASDNNEYLGEKCQKLIDNINKWRRYAVFMPSDRLIWTLYEETDLFSFCVSMYGEEAAENMILLFSRAKQFEESGYKGLFNFIRYISKLKKREEDMSQAVMFGENSDTVKIMTIHKSKGLEFPVVFLCGTSKEPNNEDIKGRVIIDKKAGLGMDNINYEKSSYSETLSKLAVKLNILKENRSEEARKLYVALTRAKEKLIVTAVCNFSSKKGELSDRKKWETAFLENGDMNPHYTAGVNRFIDWTAPVAMKNSKNWIYGEISYNEAAAPEKTYITKEETERENGSVVISDYQYPYSSETSMKVKMSVSEIKSRKSDKKIYDICELPEFMQTANKISGAEKGTAIHYVMQKYLPDGDVTYESVKKFIAKLEENQELTKQEAESVDPQAVVDFYDSDIGRRILKSSKVVREAPFEIEVPASEISDSDSKEKILIQGVIDCYFYENDQVIIVDYKSDYYENVYEIVQKYSVQLEYYSKAIEKICKKTVKNKYIYLFLTKNVIEC